MTIVKNLGIWMDHSSAHLMEFPAGSIESRTIESKFNHEAKAESLVKSENLMHHKEQHQQSEYYKLIGEAIKNYEKVILFGPTDAKAELLNILREDHRFEKIQIETQQAGKMSKHQQNAFVRKHFSKA